MESLRKLWNSWSPGQRITVVTVPLLIALIVAAAAMVRGGGDYAPLYARLRAEDASEIVGKLNEMGVPYRIGPGGAIEVPAKDLYRIRFQLASEGLPRGGTVGFELFDRMSFGTTELAQRVNLQRALQGELARTIMTLSEVEDARVHIVLPKESLFADERGEASASVIVRLRPGAHLERRQIQGIAHLVASSVEGLTPERVTILDGDGNILTTGGSDPTGLGLTSEQLAIRQQVESTLERRIQSMLERVVGQNKAIVRVSAEMDFTRRQVQREIFQPVRGNQGVVRSEQTTEEAYQSAGAASGGVPGTGSNVPTYGTPAGGASNTQYSRKQSSTTYEVNRSVVEEVASGGDVKRLSVSVLIDGTMDAQQLGTVRQVVEAGLGLDLRRGDRLIVQAIPFQRPAEEPVSEPEAKATQPAQRGVSRWMILGAGSLGGLLFLMVLLAFLLRRRRPAVGEKVPLPAAATEGDGTKRARAEEVSTLIQRAAEEQEALTLAELEKSLEQSMEDQRRLAVEREIQKLAKQRPADVAAIIRSWLAEK
jgi:flagellar M-ring protein FliF